MPDTLPDVGYTPRQQNLVERKSILKASGLLLVSFAVLNFIITAGVDGFVGHLQKKYSTATPAPITTPAPKVHYKTWVYPEIGGGSYTLRVPDSEIRMWGLPVHPVPMHVPQTGTATIMHKSLPTNTMGLPLSDIRMAGFATTRTGAGGGYGGRPYFKPHRPLHLAKPVPQHVQPLVVFPALPQAKTHVARQQLASPAQPLASIKAQPNANGIHIENGYGDKVDVLLIVLAGIAYMMGAVVSRNIKAVESYNKLF